MQLPHLDAFASRDLARMRLRRLRDTMASMTPIAITPWFARVRALTEQLTSFESITETAGERDFAAFLADLLRDLPYFKTHPDHLCIMPTRHDAHMRCNVFAYVGPAVAGESNTPTILLTGHFDVVSSANYGPLQSIACQPDVLLPRLIDTLQADSRGAADAQALDDLRSGDFMPGRGALDMKAGLAAGIAVLERHAVNPARQHGLMLVFTPDEENYSNGMRSAVQQLPALCAAWGASAILAINLDAAVNSGDGTDGRAIFMGSVSKLLPFAFFVGRPSHVGAPFDGFPASLLMAEFVREVEANPRYGDALPTHGELPPVPLVLRARELKGYYDVTTPADAFVALNRLSYSATPAEVMEGMRSAAAIAIQAARSGLLARAGLVQDQDAQMTQIGNGPASIITFEALCARCPPEVLARIQRELAALPGLDVLEITRATVSGILQTSPIEGPACIIGLAPIYYPLASVADPVLWARAQVVTASIMRDLQVDVVTRPFFTGISDMSFIGAQADADAVRVAAANAPAWQSRWPLSTDGLRVPAINIGPWGRDYHQRGERVHMPYSFGVVPELIWRFIGQSWRDLESP